MCGEQRFDIQIGPIYTSLRSLYGWDGMLRSQIIRLAYIRPELQPHLLVLAREFSSPTQLKTYLEKHPNADRNKHWVKREDETPESQDPIIQVDSKRIKNLKPKVESPDLKDIPSRADAKALPPTVREEIKDYNLSIVGNDARQAVEIARKVREGIEKSADVCKLSPSVCKGNKGLTRDKMPQIEGEKSVKAMLASQDPLKKKKGQAMVAAGADPESDKTILEHMFDHLKSHGVKIEETTIPVGTLKATQQEIKAAKVYEMAHSHLKGDFDEIGDSVVVSRDGYLLDGHHRWAALLTIDPQRRMRVKVIDMDMDDLLKEAQAVPGVYRANFQGEPLEDKEQEEYKSSAKSILSKKSKKASADTLRARTIRLARLRADLRPYLMTLLA